MSFNNIYMFAEQVVNFRINLTITKIKLKVRFTCSISCALKICPSLPIQKEKNTLYRVKLNSKTGRPPCDGLTPEPLP